jgi:ribosomal protein S18 acetylase RimI-like enzyme
MIKIRAYLDKDKNKVKKLIKKVLFEIFKVPAQGIEDLDDIKTAYFRKEGIFYVAEDRGQIIGTIAVRKEKNKIARLKRMYVNPKYRRQKIGQKLLDKVFKFCKDDRYKKIILSTYPLMGAAINFYKRNGFKKYKKTKEQLFFERKI